MRDALAFDLTVMRAHDETERIREAQAGNPGAFRALLSGREPDEER